MEKCDLIAEFLEVAIHLILYAREIYPPGIFERRKKYDVPVRMSRHPELNSYISDVVTDVRSFIKKNVLEKFVLIVLDSHTKQPPIIERFVFEFDLGAEGWIDTASLTDVQDNLRAFLLKLSVSDAILSPNPKGCTFNVLLYTSEPQRNNQWIPSDTGVEISNALLYPLKSMCVPGLNMQLLVERHADQKFLNG